MLFVLEYPAEVYVVRAKMSRRGLCLLFVLVYHAWANVVRARVSRRGLCCSG